MDLRGRVEGWGMSSMNVRERIKDAAAGDLHVGRPVALDAHLGERLRR
jgi:hypothetical protein